MRGLLSFQGENMAFDFKKLPLLNILDRIVIALAMIGGGLVLAFMVLMGTVNVLVMRKVLNAPIKGAEDLLILSLVILVAFAIPFGGRVGAHIEIEIFENRMSRGFARWSMFVLRLLAGGMMFVMTYQLVRAGQKATIYGETTQQLLISYEYFYYLLAVCVGLYVIVLFSEAVQLALHGKIRQIPLGEVVL